MTHTELLKDLLTAYSDYRWAVDVRKSQQEQESNKKQVRDLLARLTALNEEGSIPEIDDMGWDGGDNFVFWIPRDK